MRWYIQWTAGRWSCGLPFPQTWKFTGRQGLSPGPSVPAPGCRHSQSSRWAVAPSWAPARERGGCRGGPLVTCCRTKAAQHLLLGQYMTTRAGLGPPESPGAAAAFAIISRWGREVGSGQGAERLFLKGVQSWPCLAGRHRGGQDHSEERYREED